MMRDGKKFLGKLLPVLILCIDITYRGQAQESVIPAWDPAMEVAPAQDWLITPVLTRAGVYKTADGGDWILFNGLVKRAFHLSPNVVCTDYKNLITGQQLLRAVKPEARVVIDGKSYNVGGLYGQRENAYFMPSWLPELKAGREDFTLKNYAVGDIAPYIRWKPMARGIPPSLPAGKMLSFYYQSPLAALSGITVTVVYEIYDGIPLIVKWIAIENKSTRSITINQAVNEQLALVEEESAVVGSPEQMKKQHGIYVETNYAFNNAMRYDISDQTTHWKTDSAYTSQVNYNFQTPCLLEVYPEKVTGVDLAPGGTMRSVRTCELLMDSYDRERRGLAIRKMYRCLAPWTSENPVFMHLVSSNDEQVMRAVDQCRQTGYEALILSFGSHCDMEDTSAANIARWKGLSDYAHRSGIKIGGYSLFSSRRISDQDDVIDPVTGKPDAAAFFGSAPCLGSIWGLDYLEKLKFFITRAGFDLFENDGPYPGDVCASTKHPGHKGLDDSQWRQMELQKGFYHWCRENGIYVNAPDWYFLDGTNKIGIGYREVNFSLPRENQKMLNRQNIYDVLWEKTPSMAWGFVPLTVYQGGGPEAVLEPLSEHVTDYRQLMVEYYGSGVQACYRGPRLFDNDISKEAVVDVVSWYKRYRDILNSDIIHLRRPDGRDWDGIMHVNPLLKSKALLMLYNPLKEAITRTIRVPLYYTGLSKKVRLRQGEGKPVTKTVDRNYEIELTFRIEPESFTWFELE